MEKFNKSNKIKLLLTAGVVLIMQLLLCTGSYAVLVMKDIGTLGGKYSEAVAINNKGQVIGYSSVSDNKLPDWKSHSFIWENGQMIDMGSLGGITKAEAINDKGQVIGYYINSDGIVRGFIWEDGKMTDLGGLGGNYTEAVAINENGQVIGQSELADGSFHGFMWENGKMTDLGTLGQDDSEAVAINDRGQVVGFSSIPDNNSKMHGFMWENGKMTDLGIGGCYPKAINEKGQVVGYLEPENGVHHGFIWEEGKVTDLGTLDGHDSEAIAINENGQVIGQLEFADGSFHGFVWENGKMTDLKTFGGRNSETTAINDKGQVVGYSEIWGGTRHGFIWQSGRTTDLGTIDGINSEIVAINDNGRAVGYSYLIGCDLRGALWEDSEIPVVTINPYNTKPTSDEVTVTASVNKGTLNETSHTFSENGSFTFVATSEAGTAKRTVTITNIDKTLPPEPKISPSEIHIDTGSFAPVSPTIGHNTISSIMNGTGILTPDVDYKISGNVVTINKSYLEYYFTKFPDHNLYLNFNFTSGKSSVLTIYTGETPHAVLTDVFMLDKFINDAKLNLVPNGNFITGIKNGESLLVPRIDYTYDPSKHILYIRRGYLNDYFSSSQLLLRLTVYFTGDSPKRVTIVR